MFKAWYFRARYFRARYFETVKAVTAAIDAVMSKRELQALRKRLRRLRELQDADREKRNSQQESIANLVRSVFAKFDVAQQHDLAEALPINVLAAPATPLSAPRVDYDVLYQHGDVLSQIDGLLKTIVNASAEAARQHEARAAVIRKMQDDALRASIAQWVEQKRQEAEQDEEDVALLLQSMADDEAQIVNLLMKMGAKA